LNLLKRRDPEDDFAHRVMRRLKERGWPHEVRYERAEFALIVDESGAQLNLGRLFQEWRTYPKRERSAQLDRVIAPALESRMGDSYEEAAPRLLPVVRSLTELQAGLMEGEPPTIEVWQDYRMLVSPLAAILAIDLPNTTALLPRERAAAWGRSSDELMATALDNLIARSPVRFTPQDGGFYLSDYPDGYDASRLLLPELFLALQLPGDPVAVAVQRNKVVVAGSGDPEALAAMAAFVVEDFATTTRPMSYQPLILRDRTWFAFDPAPSPQFAAIRELSRRQHLWDYDIQTPRLERYLEHLDEDVFVAPLEVAVLDEAPHTWSTWTENVPALLPRADGLGLTTLDERRLFRTWDAIEAVCGLFMPDERFHPLRYRAPPWPSAEAWRRLETEFATPDWWEENVP